MHTESTPKKLIHVPALDGLRGLAVLMVCFYHLGGGATSRQPIAHLLGTLNKAGWSGVTLFFLLSGYLITEILWNSKGQSHWWRNFYARRALRIMPLYYGVLLLLLFIALFQGHLHAALNDIWVSLLYLQNIRFFLPRILALPTQLYVEHLWTLAVEEQFYLLWPFFILLLKTRRQAAWFCCGIFTLSLLYRIASWHWPSLGNTDSLPARAGELALGGWLTFLDQQTLLARYRAWFIAVFFAALAIFFASSYRLDFQLFYTSTYTFGLAEITLAYLCLLALALQPGILNRALSLSPLRWLGKISYGIYIYHLLFVRSYNAVTTYLFGATQGPKFILCRFFVSMALTILLAWASYTFYERPFLKLKKYFKAIPSTS